MTTPEYTIAHADAWRTRLQARVAAGDIPETADIHTAQSLAASLAALDEPPLSLIAVGDIMVGGRTRAPLRAYGSAYPFAGVAPLLLQAPIVVGNLEGPLATHAERVERQFSYRVNPATAADLRAAGINVVTLANNHLLDCRRAGVLETLEALAHAGVAVIGAGRFAEVAHAPAILTAPPLRVGLLGYYWNRRTSATKRLPGSAMDTHEALATDIAALRPLVDRVVVTCHWGVPYEREVTPDVCARARFAIDCGADVVIGHHPHVLQAVECYGGGLIAYSVGNFTFGSGNSQAESLLVGLRFTDAATEVQFYPLYVKNRDPRVDYQPKALRGAAAAHWLQKLVTLSGETGTRMRLEESRAVLTIPYEAIEDTHRHG
jgi:hypothetical protein